MPDATRCHRPPALMAWRMAAGDIPSAAAWHLVIRPSCPPAKSIAETATAISQNVDSPPILRRLWIPATSRCTWVSFTDFTM